VFTGIISDIGEIIDLQDNGDRRFEIATAYDLKTIDLGASIASSGVCLTVIEMGTRDGVNFYAVEASKETLDLTTAGQWQVGTKLNLERALRLGDELGGHLVSGHVDGIAKIISIRPEGASKRFVFEVPDSLKKYIAVKGSVSLDGTSLTVNEVDDNQFGVNMISHTQDVTCWGYSQEGDLVNLEIDVLARYVARLQE
jgi:riboflavin synthase